MGENRDSLYIHRFTPFLKIIHNSLFHKCSSFIDLNINLPQCLYAQINVSKNIFVCVSAFVMKTVSDFMSGLSTGVK